MKVVHRVSAIKIYDTLDRSVVKTNQRLFVSCSHTKACNFPALLTFFSETVLNKLSPLNTVHNNIMAINKSVQPLNTLSSRLKSLHVYVTYSEKIDIHLFDCFRFLA